MEENIIEKPFNLDAPTTPQIPHILKCQNVLIFLKLQKIVMAIMNLNAEISIAKV